MRARPLLAGGVAAGILATSCSGDSLSPEAAVAQAATRTAEEGTARFVYRATTRAHGQINRSRGHGTWDFAARRGRVEVRDEDDSMTLEQIFDGLVTYYRTTPPFSDAFPEAKEWVRQDPLEFDRLEISLALAELGQINPATFLARLRAISGDVEEVGEERIDGRETTHYFGVADLRLVADEAPPERRAAVRRSVDALLRRGGEAEVPTDVWVDDEGLVRRVAQRLTFVTPATVVPPGKWVRTEAEWTIDFVEFGLSVAIELPAPDNVMSERELYELARRAEPKESQRQ
jgi:hypothetical protein